jgi:hypothetical protein
LAGFFDAEGSISLHQSTFFGFEISIANKNRSLLEQIYGKMIKLGYDPRLGRTDNDLWRVYMWKKNHVSRFLKTIPFKHPEKRDRAMLALQIQASEGTAEEKVLIPKWDELLVSIKRTRDTFVEEAKRKLEEI